MYSKIFILLFAVPCFAQNETPTEMKRNQICKKRNSYYGIEGSCDSYVECREYHAQDMLCPDGLHYNPLVKWPNYPCGYPVEVSCQGRGTTQKPIPTAECPHQYGYYVSPLASSSNCGYYRTCVGGRAFDMECPLGLAFNHASARCDWPGLVPTCDANAFLGFKCPEPAVGANGEVLNTTSNHRYEGDCVSFFSCERGLARLLTCDVGYAFDPYKGHCVDADLVRCELPGTSNQQTSEPTPPKANQQPTNTIDRKSF